MDTKILVFCIGNSSRADDGLGWMFADRLSDLTDTLEIEYRYQLQIEDTLLIQEYSQVIFVDASRIQYDCGYSFDKCIATPTDSFTTHALTPESVIWLTHELFNYHPEAYVLAISGYHWDLGKKMSGKARRNFENALSFFKNWLAQIVVQKSGSII